MADRVFDCRAHRLLGVEDSGNRSTVLAYCPEGISFHDGGAFVPLAGLFFSFQESQRKDSPLGGGRDCGGSLLAA